MRRTFFRYFGISIEKRKKANNINIGINLVSDEIVFIGIVVSIVKVNLGLWIHKITYKVGTEDICI